MLSTQTLEVPAGQIREIAVPGSYFRYVSGTVSTGSDLTINVRFGNGADEVELLPGQGIRIPEAPRTWSVRNKTAGALTIKLVIGDGEFVDSTVSFAGGVNVTNEVEVKNDNASPLNVSIAGGEVEIKNDTGNPLVVTNPAGGYVQVQENLLPTNLGLSGTSVNSASNVVTLVAPGANVNGLIVHQARLYGNGAANYALIGKATPPVGNFDGVVLLVVPSSLSASGFVETTYKTKLPPGVGLYMYTNVFNGTVTFDRFINCTLL